MTKRTIDGLIKIIEEMQYLVEHPRIQQKTWVAKGRVWLPVLQNAKEDLESSLEPHNIAIEGYQALLSTLQRIGLTVEKRDNYSWGYRWNGGELKGAYSSSTEAIEWGLREKLD